MFTPVWAQIAKFKYRQYFQLYGISDNLLFQGGACLLEEIQYTVDLEIFVVKVCVNHKNKIHKIYFTITVSTFLYTWFHSIYNLLLCTRRPLLRYLQVYNMYYAAGDSWQMCYDFPLSVQQTVCLHYHSMCLQRSAVLFPVRVVCQQLRGSHKHSKLCVFLACSVLFQITKPGNVELI